MAADETPEDRLEAALERIATVVEARGAAPLVDVHATEGQNAMADQVAARLDHIIETLRDALGK